VKTNGGDRNRPSEPGAPSSSKGVSEKPEETHKIRKMGAAGFMRRKNLGGV